MRLIFTLLLVLPYIATAQSDYIPELTPVDVYENLEEVGFTTEKDLGSDLGNFWTCKIHDGGITYTVEISSDDVNKVQSIRGTVRNFNLNKSESRQFFKYLASTLFLYRKFGESKLNEWIDRNFNRDGATTSVGSVGVKIQAPSDMVRIIYIDSNFKDGI